MLTDPNLEILAYHEAGHAAVAAAVGAPVIRVFIRRPGTGCETADGWGEQSPTHTGAAMVIAFAGGASEFLQWPDSYPGAPRDGVSISDMKEAESCAARLTTWRSDLDRNRLFDRAWGEAIRVLSIPQVRALAVAIAGELLRQGEVSGTRVAELARRHGVALVSSQALHAPNRKLKE